MSLLSKTLKAITFSNGLEKGKTAPVRLWQLTEDDAELQKLQREIAKKSLQAPSHL
ncbi:hypothetical protein [Tritonibacter litoralis]|uniref:hypothetical protein n=1 Tax=Tritonibacter litoralis TaxID=2662264 RepID=UPI001292A8E1|nr:hypothetical protein [Tritonibacter litoralis]